ncbi:MAG: ECF-type sigma factor [Vicinamibacterales bacterium]
MDGSSSRGDVTRLLQLWSDGDRGALDDLMPLVYAELRRIADGYFARERAAHTLQPTALIDEAWMRMARQQRPSFDHRRQFYALAAQMMRRILVDHARAAGADKRGGEWTRTQLDTALDASLGVDAPPLVDLLALDRALTRLAAVSPRQARVIELRYFAGLGVEDLAQLLDVSPATISRDQRVAEAWLGQAMAGGA